ncbi:MAG TPA: nucleoside-diphosphate sugar epimerase/dehydratase [Burkholderiaceae bacterium]|nr:nucleoside-diphosphate sugar epimerase/dehydratase [Burkholderiaceae bacterium]
MFKTSGRAMLVFAYDLCAVAVAWLAAFWLRFNLTLPDDFTHAALLGLLWVVPIYGASFLAHRLYRGLWQFASLPDLFRLTRAVASGGAIVLAAAFLVRDHVVVPRTVLVLSPVLLILAMAGARITYRAWREHGLSGGLIAQGEPVLVLGAGRTGAALAREFARSPTWRILGFLDDDRSKVRRELLGHRVLGRIEDVERLAVERGVRTVIMALPSADAATQRRIAQTCVRAGLRVLRAPRIDELADGRTSVSSVRGIALEDLLGRETVSIDTPHVGRMLQGKVILVTGAGGSIGSEICRQVARFAPARIVFLENNEFALYRLEEEFALRHPQVATVALIGDVKDARRVDQVLVDHQPAVIFHAAAYKHVPLMENRNAWQAVLNNVVGTTILAQAAVARGVDAFVLVSTDKAVNPVNVMGATKRLAEMVCQALQQSAACPTRFVLVRFGNVVGSAGSVVPKFQEQIERGGPLTVTHPEVTRYFMSIPEAAQLVLQAASMGRGGEIYVMDMGQPVRIADLARDMIRLAGHTEQEIRIDFTGLRPGEKLFEEVLAPAEQTLATPHPKLRIARARPVEPEWLLAFIGGLRDRPDPGDDATRRMLKRIVPEYEEPPVPVVAAPPPAAPSLAAPGDSSGAT